MNFLSVYFLSLNAVLGPTLTYYKSHYKNNNNKKNNSYCILTTNTQFRIENNTWVQVDMEFFSRTGNPFKTLQFILYSNVIFTAFVDFDNISTNFKFHNTT